MTGTNPVGVLAREGGRINLDSANSIPVTLHPASISFGLFRGNVPVDDIQDLTLLNVDGTPQTCSVAVTGSTPAATVIASPSSFALSPGGTTTLTITLDGGTNSQTAGGDYSGDVEVTCGPAVMKTPWFVRVDRESMPADVNLDQRVDILDAALVAFSFDARETDPLWNRGADLDYSGSIDILDAAMVASYYGAGT